MIKRTFFSVVIAVIVLIVLILLWQLLLQIWTIVSSGSVIGRRSAEIAGALIVDIEPAVEIIDEKPAVIIGQAKWQAEIADTAWLRARGLSNRESLPEDQGMLFVFAKPGVYKFWMKGMKFPLDFVWIKSTGENQGVVADISENVPPISLDNLVYYHPLEPVNFVLEINAGQVARWGIKIGDKVKLKI